MQSEFEKQGRTAIFLQERRTFVERALKEHGGFAVMDRIGALSKKGWCNHPFYVGFTGGFPRQGVYVLSPETPVRRDAYHYLALTENGLVEVTKMGTEGGVPRIESATTIVPITKGITQHTAELFLLRNTVIQQQIHQSIDAASTILDAIDALSDPYVPTELTSIVPFAFRDMNAPLEIPAPYRERIQQARRRY